MRFGRARSHCTSVKITDRKQQASYLKVYRPLADEDQEGHG
jgi:hypothetical protein